MIGNNRELEKFVMNLHLITDCHTNKSGQTHKRLTLFAIILHVNHKKFVDIGQLIDLVVPVDTLRDFFVVIRIRIVFKLYFSIDEASIIFCSPFIIII